MTQLEFENAKKLVEGAAGADHILSLLPYPVVPDSWGAAELIVLTKQLQPLVKTWTDERIGNLVTDEVQALYTDAKAGLVALKGIMEDELEVADPEDEAGLNAAIAHVALLISYFPYAEVPETWTLGEQVTTFEKINKQSSKWVDLRIGDLITNSCGGFYTQLRFGMSALVTTLNNEFAQDVPYAIKDCSPSYNPASDSKLTLYPTSTAGTYTNFPDSGGTPIVVNSGELAILFPVSTYFVKVTLTVGTSVLALSKPEELIKTYSIGKDAGRYLTSNTAVASYPNAGFINSSGTVTAGSFFCTNEIDVSGCTHLYFMAPPSGSAGYIFYDASHVVVPNSFGTGDGSYHYLKVPAGAKYFRNSRSNSVTDANATIYLRNFVELASNEVAFFDNGAVRKLIDKSNALELATTASLVPQPSIAIAAGVYRTKETTLDDTTFAPGFYATANNTFTGSGSYKGSPLTDITGYTHIEAKLAYGSSAGITWYNASGTFMFGTSGTNPDENILVKYAIPYGAKYARIARLNTITEKITRIIKEVTVAEKQIAFFNQGDATIFDAVNGSSITLVQLMSMLPEDDGSGVGAGEFYRHGGYVKYKAS